MVVGRGWNRYNFNQMLELAADPRAIPANRQDAFERNRNLFYVTCSRPKKRLAVLFREPCVGSREGAGEASVAAWMGRAIEHRKSDGPG